MTTVESYGWSWMATRRESRWRGIRVIIAESVSLVRRTANRNKSYLDGIISENAVSYLWMDSTTTGRIDSCDMGVLLSSLVGSVHFPLSRRTAALSFGFSSSIWLSMHRLVLIFRQVMNFDIQLAPRYPLDSCDRHRRSGNLMSA